MTKNISNITQEESMIISKIIPKIIDTEVRVITAGSMLH